MATEMRECPRCRSMNCGLETLIRVSTPACLKCHLTGPSLVTTERAVEWWNTRVPDPLLKEMAKLLQHIAADEENNFWKNGFNMVDEAQELIARYRAAYPEETQCEPQS